MFALFKTPALPSLQSVILASAFLVARSYAFLTAVAAEIPTISIGAVSCMEEVIQATAFNLSNITWECMSIPRP